MNTIDYDKFGHCIKCHKNMIIEQVIDNEVRKRMSTDYREVEFLLSSGSRMRVAICKDCQETLSEKEHNSIMECVVNGWKKELEELHHWSKEKKDNYMETYGKLTISSRLENQNGID
jgi:hypothetical protein